MIDRELQSHGFWETIERLVCDNEFVIERPRGSQHPDYPELIYPCDYGFLRVTRSSDREEIDIWLGSLESRKVNGLILTLDLKKGDLEVKLLVGCTRADQLEILKFSNRDSMQAEIIERDDRLAWLGRRRTVRNFLPRPIPQELLIQVLKAATWAPSAHNRQPWRFVILESAISRQTLADSMGDDYKQDLLADGISSDEADHRVARSKSRIMSAPSAIVLCLDTACADQYPDAARQQAEYLMGVQSAALAGGTLLLAAHAMGLEGVWMCAPLFTPDNVRLALRLPESWQPQALILLGYPDEIPKTRTRKDLDEIAVFL